MKINTRCWEAHSVLINSTDVGYSVAGAANVLHREKHATLIQLVIVLIKTAISYLWPISFCVFFVIAEFCKNISVCQEVGWLDHSAKEEQFSRLDGFHHSCILIGGCLSNACAAGALSRKRRLEAVGSLSVVDMEWQKGVGEGRHLEKVGGGQNRDFKNSDECGIDSVQLGTYDWTYCLHNEKGKGNQFWPGNERGGANRE